MFHRCRSVLQCFGRNLPLLRWMELTYPGTLCEEFWVVREAAHLPQLSAEDLTSRSEVSCDSRMSKSSASSEELPSSGGFLWLIPSCVSALTQASPPCMGRKQKNRDPHSRSVVVAAS